MKSTIRYKQYSENNFKFQYVFYFAFHAFLELQSSSSQVLSDSLGLVTLTVVSDLSLD